MRTTIRLVGPAILLVLLLAGLSVASAQQGSNGSSGRTPTSMSLAPAEAWSCIRDQQVFTASATDAVGGVEGARVEFMLNRFAAAVGDIVEVSGNRPSKLSNNFSTVYTDANGQASATLTATRPGDTDITAFVPAIQDNSAHKAYGVMHWVDGCPAFPGDAENPIDFDHPMGVTVLRVSDGGPVEGVPVRWTVIDDDPDARFVGAEGDGNVIVARTDASGVSNVTLEQVSPLIGDNEVYIEVLTEDGETMFAQSMVKVWKSPILALSPTGPGTVGLLELVTYSIEVSNTGDFLATETVLTADLPAGLAFETASHDGVAAAAADGTGQTVTWDIGELGIGGSVTVSVTAQAILVGTQDSQFGVRSFEGLEADGQLSTRVIPGVLDVRMTGPEQVDLGGQATYSIQVLSTGQGSSTEVKLIDSVPAGMSFVSSDTASTQQGSQIIFDLGTLEQGQLATVQVVLQADQPGSWANSALATSAEGASDDAQITTQVVRPVLAVTKTGPESALVNTDFEYSITVTNNGDGNAYSATLTDTLPAGLTYVSSSPEATVDGSTVTWSVGDIAPNGGETTVTLTVKGTEGGAHENVVVASAEGVGIAGPEARATTTILVPAVSIEKTGPTALFIGNEGTYTLTATNSGDATLTGVTITEDIPAGMSYVSSDPAGAVSEDMTQVVWDVGSLEVDASASVTVTLQADAEGAIANTATASSTEGATAASDPLEIMVLPAAGATIAISDSSDPIREGEQTEFTVTVDNQGRSAITGVTIEVAIPSAMTVVTTSNGQTTVSEDGRTVSFALAEALATGDSFSFTITVEANALPEGENQVAAVTTATLTYNEFSLPVSTDEGTTIIEQ